MSLLEKFAAWSIAGPAALLFIMQLAAHGIGYRVGRLKSSRQELPSDRIGVLVGALLGMLAFVLALTLNFATSRFYELRQGTLAEANAIGTAALRAQAIGQKEGEEIVQMLEEYARLRRDFIAAPYGAPSLAAIDARTAALQSAIWTDLGVIVRAQPNPVSTSLMNALNDVFDMTTAERFAYDLRIPAQIFWLLIVLTLVGSGTLGFQMAIKSRAPFGLSALLMLAWTLVILAILDMGSPRFGGIRTSVSAYDWTLEGIVSLQLNGSE